MRTQTAPPPPPNWWEIQSPELSRFAQAHAEFNWTDAGFVRGEAAGVFKRVSRNGMRVFFAGYGGSGTADIVRFGRSVEINVNNFVLPTLSRRVYAPEEPLILLRASLACDVVFNVEGMVPMVFNRPELTMVCLPRGTRLLIDAQGGVRQQGVNGIFTPSAFADSYGLQAEDLPGELRQAVHGNGAVGRVVSLPLDHRVAALVADTIDSPLEGEMRALQYAGRLSELVAFALDAVRRNPAAAAPLQARGEPLRWRDADLAQLAQQRLAHDYRQPPLFADLAHELGTNTNRLQAAFKAAFGGTMAEYCLGRRMREAQQLLLEAKLSVAEVAGRVGYAHQSNFAAAFSAQLGMSPREYRRHRAPYRVSLEADAEGDASAG